MERKHVVVLATVADMPTPLHDPDLVLVAPHPYANERRHEG